jgi:hypothetical protein
MIKIIIHMFKALFALMLVAISGLVINGLELLSVLIRPFSRYHYRLFNKILIGLQWPVLVWLIEKWSNVKIKMYGEYVSPCLPATRST